MTVEDKVVRKAAEDVDRTTVIMMVEHDNNR